MFSVSRRVARATAFILLQNRALAITRLGTKDPRMSQIVTHGDTVYLSGQVPADFEAPLADQVSSTLAKVDALLDEAGTDKSKRAAASRARVAPPRLDRLDAAPPRPQVAVGDHLREIHGSLRGDERDLERLDRLREQARARVRRGPDGAARDPLRGRMRRGQISAS